MNNIKWSYTTELLKPTVIEEFEKQMNISLPNDIKVCMKNNNGGMPDKKYFDTNETKGRIFNNLLSFNLNKDEDTIYDTYRIFQGKLPYFPFALDPFGNVLCLKEGKVILWLHETGEIENAADSFTELLKKLYD